ncbi:hypothetical protein PoB_006046600 [Plakobranchus ocellatus]|uniref:Uncharacterized protein n=1 Tax=Plakobranchus ocellatus TaxID=259542 RepID=A0AAV4CQ73_9GAST|nr:hypothetical protein PoB_006046600 [Plakobranchus ocellatus]
MKQLARLVFNSSCLLSLVSATETSGRTLGGGTILAISSLEELQNFIETVDTAAYTITELCASQQHSCRDHCGEPGISSLENIVISFSI